MNAKQDLGKYAVELASGAALLAIGVTLTAVGSTDSGEAWQSVVGGGLTALGGFLLSWIIARAQSTHATEEAKTEARQDIYRRLDSISRSLGQSALQLEIAADSASSGTLGAEALFEVIRHARTSIVGQVTELGEIRGTNFDPLLETQSRLNLLKEGLESGEVDEEAAARQVDEIQQLIAAESSASVTVERVRCPNVNCGEPNAVELRDHVGATTGGVTCERCRTVYNVHRKKSGVETVPQGAAFQPTGRLSHETVEVVCKGCGKRVEVDLRTTTPATAHAKCECGEVTIIHRTSTGLKYGGDSGPIDPAQLVEVECGSCGQTRRRRHSQGAAGPVSVVCLACNLELLADPETSSISSTVQLSETEVGEDHIASDDGNRPRVSCPSCTQTTLLPMLTESGARGACLTCKTVIVLRRTGTPEAASLKVDGNAAAASGAVQPEVGGSDSYTGDGVVQ